MSDVSQGVGLRSVNSAVERHYLYDDVNACIQVLLSWCLSLMILISTHEYLFSTSVHMRSCVARFCRTPQAAAAASVVAAKVEVVDAIPSPTEAPHLLEVSSAASAQESRPFLNPTALKAFSAALLVGGLCAGSVYVLLSKSISDQFAEEREIVERIRMVVQETSQPTAEPATLVAKQTSKAVLGDFSSPSTFAELQEKMSHIATHKKQHLANQQNTPMLHQEAVFRFKSAWNSAITNVQISLETFAVEYQLRRERLAEEGIRKQLQYAGVEVEMLKRL